MKRGKFWFGVNRTLIITLVLILVFELLAFGFVDRPLTGDAIKSILKPKTASTSTAVCTPSMEICDRKDNDCDGKIDEGNICSPYSSIAGMISPEILTSSQKTSYFSVSTDPPGTTDYYGAVNIDGIPAPPGTFISAITQQDIVCGTFMVTNQNPGIGFYGFLHCNCGGDSPTCNGENIRFGITIPGQSTYKLAVISGNTVWDQSVKRVDIAINTKCTDGTLYNQCTGLGSEYCAQQTNNSGVLVHNCSICGCPSVPKPYYCRDSGYCTNEALKAESVRDDGGIL